MPNVVVRKLKKDDLRHIADLFKRHSDSPFVYSADVRLFRIFQGLAGFKGFVAEAYGKFVGCVYALQYLYNCGWIGGLLVHRDFRRIGIGRKLLSRALNFLGHGHNYLFVVPDNKAARSLFGDMGFRALYRRFNFSVDTPKSKRRSLDEGIKYDVEWSDLTRATGFKQRHGTVNLGYYPVKVTRTVFEDLKRGGKILRSGKVVAIVDNSFRITLKNDEFIFNRFLLNDMVGVVPKGNVIEVNPFYLRPEFCDLERLVGHLAEKGKVSIWTYEDDSVAAKLSLKGSLGAVVMEACRC